MKIGDVVALPSGSPRMTVIEIGDVNAKVVWVNYTTHEPHELVLPKEIFVPASKPEVKDNTAPPWMKTNAA